MSLKITILSGGSGNDRLIKGLKAKYKNCDIKVITNMYDSGKSTGICRLVTNTLGVSDVRKNHARLYEIMTENPNKSILEFYNNRYDLSKVNPLSDVLDLLDKWDLTEFRTFAIGFFSRFLANQQEYKDFNIANIIYSEMYADLGYEKTNEIFCNMLGIDDFVLCNSFDNVYIKALTECGNIIDDEGKIVDYKSQSDKIKSIIYEGTSQELNIKAIERIIDSDLIIISTGTFWSSIYPTLDYLDFYKIINKSTAKKIWAINNEEDKDAYGVSSNDFIDKLSELGLNLEDFTILENLDAIDSLKLPNTEFNIVRKHMGNINGKHDGDLFATEILNIYYNLNEQYDKIIFDFDDTLWSRMAHNDQKARKQSINNLLFLNDKLKDKAVIISGNTYNSISKKLYDLFGTDLKNCNLEIWADSNGRKYIQNKVVDTLDKLIIDDDAVTKICELIYVKFGLYCKLSPIINTLNIKIKGLQSLERKLLATYLNENVLEKFNCVAKITGTTTVDIVHKDNDKSAVFEHCEFDKLKTLYIGDEISSGNDKNIAMLCTNYINVSDIYETGAVLNLIGGKNES